MEVAIVKLLLWFHVVVKFTSISLSSLPLTVLIYVHSTTLTGIPQPQQQQQQHINHNQILPFLYQKEAISQDGYVQAGLVGRRRTRG